MKRFFIIFICLIVLLSFCVIPAFASDFTLSNFVYTSSSDGETFTNQYRFLPVTPSRIDITSGSKSYHFNSYKFRLDIDSYGFKVDDYLTVTYSPRGTDAYFSIDDFYSGSLKYEQLNTFSGLSYLADSESVTLKFYDKDKNYISNWVGRANMSNMRVPYNAYYLNFSYSVIFLITAKSISINYSTVWLTNVYSASEAVKHDMNKPARDPILPDNGPITDMQGVEDQLLSGADNAKTIIGSMATSAAQTIKGLASSLGFATSLISNVFMSNNWLYTIFHVSLTVGIFALLVNLTASFIGRKKDD